MTSRPGLRVTPTQRLALSGSLQTALRVLRMDAMGLTRYLEEQAAETPALKITPAAPRLGEWLPRWSGVGLGDTQHQIQAIAAVEPSLMSHVVQHLPDLVPAGPDRMIALALTEALEPSGWLGRQTEDLAAELGVAPAQVNHVLTQLQRITPAGLFARTLSECLRLQAVDAGVLDEAMAALLDNLELVAVSDWTALAKRASVSEDDIRRSFALLRGFNPKPGTGFAAVASPLREPDLVVRKAAKGWEVHLNHLSLPGVSIMEGAEDTSRARAVIRLVQGRNDTLLRVGRALLLYQVAALDNGPSALRPLTMQALADDLALHKSTVSRVIAGAAVDTPHGTWWLRSLFSPDMGGGAGAAALRARLQQLVAEEDKSNPLSDDALARALSADGADVARRTVAKYRGTLRIAPAHRRRQRRKP